MNKLIVNIDSTSLSSSDCILNFFRTIVGSIDPLTGQSQGGFKEKRMGCSMIYGIAIHKFIEKMYSTGGNYKVANTAAQEIFLRLPATEPGRGKDWLRDPKHLMTTCYNLWSSYVEEDHTFDVLMIGDKPATEITFKVKFYEDDILIVYLCGTLDTLGKFKNGVYAIRDWKTTSGWDTLNYFKYYELSKQLRMYRLACKLMAQENPESTLGQMGATKMGAFIDAIFLKSKPNDNTYARSDVFCYSDSEIESFQQLLKDKCAQLSWHLRENSFPKQGIIHDTCEKKYGKCRFWNVCAKPDNVGEILLRRDFSQVHFDPLQYNSEL